MTTFKNEDALRVWLINKISESFPDNAILKGGMQLRLIDSPRYTNDIDYTFIPFDSKKEILEPLVSFLSSLKEITEINYKMNSKCLRINIIAGILSCVIEVNVEKECPYDSISSGSVARTLNLTGRVVKVMDFSYSMANKLGAWLERDLLRDLYDCYFFHTFLKITPDYEQLKKRLSDINYTKKNGRKKSMTLTEFSEKIILKSETLTEKQMDELSGLLDKDELPGLYIKMKKALIQIADKIIIFVDSAPEDKNADRSNNLSDCRKRRDNI